MLGNGVPKARSKRIKYNVWVRWIWRVTHNYNYIIPQVIIHISCKYYFNYNSFKNKLYLKEYLHEYALITYCINLIQHGLTTRAHFPLVPGIHLAYMDVLTNESRKIKSLRSKRWEHGTRTTHIPLPRERVDGKDVLPHAIADLVWIVVEVVVVGLVLDGIHDPAGVSHQVDHLIHQTRRQSVSSTYSVLSFFFCLSVSFWLVKRLWLSTPWEKNVSHFFL